jgi:hypothetical protein
MNPRTHKRHVVNTRMKYTANKLKRNEQQSAHNGFTLEQLRLDSKIPYSKLKNPHLTNQRTHVIR